MKTLKRIVVPVLIVLFLIAGASYHAINQTIRETIHLFKGTAYANKRMWDKGIVEFNKAIEINPRYAEAYVYRGLAYAYKSQYDQAISDYNEALEINPEFAEAYFMKATACEKINHVQEAIKAYKSFIQYAPLQFSSLIEQARERIKELEK
jgi:tetratricopeptide (TPR) repeat protein